MSKAPRIALVANTSWSIYNFRLGLIRHLRKRGFDVVLVAPIDKYSSKLIAEGFRLIPLTLHSYGTNPLSEILLLLQLLRIYRRQRPDLVFHYTIKPNIYGTIAAAIYRIPSVAITTGLGLMLSSKNRLVRFYTHRMYWLVGRLARETWFLNKSDLRYFLERKLVRQQKTQLLPGEGVDTGRFAPGLFPQKNDGKIHFLFAGRLIKEKGILEYVEAARHISQQHPDVVFDVLGFIETENPSSIRVEQLEAWQVEGIVQYLGETEDVRPYIEQADCVVLPSYREGTSRILLEAAAMGKPIIASDVPGCREVVDDRVSGFLCLPENATDLAARLAEFIHLSANDKKVMGLAGRKKVVEVFGEEKIIGLYTKTLREQFPSNRKGKISIALSF
jgi:glycosyltransferase involved in cell wall biosynthesis